LYQEAGAGHDSGVLWGIGARAVITFVSEGGEFTVPAEVVDINSFRRWLDSPEFPQRGRIWWLCGKVWADMSREQIFTHLAIKSEYTIVLGGLAKATRRGLFLPDGLLLSNFAADISGNPDATFILNETLDSDRTPLIEGAETGFVEVQGSPDMVLEVLSDGSVQKDLVVLRRAYCEADIREYWLVDVRKDALVFEILRHTAKGYVATRAQSGWIKSTVFGKSFRLTRVIDRRGYPEYTLRVK
jgi:Uma2 family endonuclease